MSVAKKVIMGSGAVESAYEIEQSLIFNAASDTGLRRIPSTTGNRKTFTTSFWIKRTKPGNQSFLISSGEGSGGLMTQLRINTSDQLFFQDYNWVTSPSNMRAKKIGNRVFRDTGAWQHWVWACDTTLSTAADRNRIYVDGVLQTSMSTDQIKAQNENTWVNYSGYSPVSGTTSNAFSMDVGFSYYYIDNNAGYNFDGYMAEVHHIDGLAKAPTEFGETNSDTGQWIPKEYTGGNYGTNGYYLKFASGAIGTDSSGQGNNFTVLNLTNADVVPDSPTNNFATLNPSDDFANGTFSEGNLKVVTPSNGHGLSIATIVPSSGKFYAEFTPNNTGEPAFGVRNLNQTGLLKWVPEGVKTAYAYYSPPSGDGYIYKDNGSGGVTPITAGSNFTAGDVVALTIDYDNGQVKFYNQNTLKYTASSLDLTDVAIAVSDADETNSTTTWVVNFGQNGTFSGLLTAGGNTDANGIGDFFYAPPSGFLALCTANLPEPAIPLPSAQFNTVLYTGNGGTQSISGVGHQPDWVWIKNRAAADNHKVVDAVRGATKELETNQANAETTNADGLTAFASDGFALGDDNEYNTNGEAYVSWNWKANGAGSTDTSGDIDGVLSANPTAGFSIVTWTGTGTSAPNANATIPHGLGVVPDFVWYKSRVGSSWENWIHSSIISGNKRMLLQSTAAVSDINSNYLLGGEIATSSMISNNGHTTSQTVVAYCFASKPGFSKIGVYTGNGSAAGPFVNLGFKPAWVMIKGTSAVNEWYLYDAARSPANEINYYLEADTADAEAGMDKFDFLSNGFKIRNGYGGSNTNNGVYLYMAFAEAPFKYANAR